MNFTADSIAALVNGTVEGNGSAQVCTFAKIEEGQPGAISFLANPKYTHYIYDTRSSVVLVSNDFVPERPVSCTLIRVADPYQTIAHLLDMANKAATTLPSGIEQPCYVAEGVDVHADVYVGAFAYLAKGVKLGRGAKIFPQVYLGENVEVGEDTIIYPGVKVYKGCRIGARCVIHSGAVIGADGFGFAPTSAGNYDKIPQMGIVEIADDVEIGANTTIDRAVMGATRIHQGVKLDNLIQIGHNVEVGANTVMAAQAGIAGSTKVGEQCMIAGQVGLAGHLNIGDKVQIGAQSGVNKNVPSGQRIFGYPATNAVEYARQLTLLRRLPNLFAEVDNIKKDLKV